MGRLKRENFLNEEREKRKNCDKKKKEKKKGVEKPTPISLTSDFP